MSLKILRPEGLLQDSFILKDREKKHLVILPAISSTTQLKYKLGKGASLKVQYIVTSGNHIANLDFELNKGAELVFDSAIRLQGNDALDFNYKVVHLGAESKSHFNLVGTLDDQAKKNSTETIDFKAGATNAEGSECERITLLSDSIKNAAQPIILCDEENMHGTHSFSSSHLDSEVVNYLRTRGVDLAAAKKIISREQIRRVVELCKNKAIIEEILEALQ